MDARAREKEKQNLFNELYKLDTVENEDAETSPLKAFTHRTTAEQLGVVSSATRPLSIQRFGRTVSEPTHVDPTPPSASPSMIEDTPIASPKSLSQPVLEIRAPRPGPTSKSFPAPENKGGMPKTGDKRKRRQSLDVLPESQRIFAGLSFYFLRNDDIDPARRLRIRRALERGALWVREWRDDVTHIIADKNLCYNDIISFLKITSLPPNVVLVNQTYPSDCINYRAVLNPKQPQYQVDGYKQAQITDEPVTLSSSDRSLLLKPDRSAFARGPQTPSRTESEHESLRQALKDAETRAHEEQRQRAKQAQSEGTHDALDDAIAEATNLPIDPDEDEGFERGAVADEAEEGESEDELKTKKVKWKKASNDQSWQQNFNCMQKHDGLDQSDNPNSRTIEVLQEMCDYYARKNDHWRVTAYRKAITALRKLNVKIMTKAQAFAIPFIGERLADKIEEIVWTDKLRRLDNANLEPNDEALQLFLNIYGVGLAQASAWVDQGLRKLDDLLTQDAKLTKNQEIGVKYYKDFLARVPRHEVEMHGRVVRDAIRRLDPDVQVTIGGSYRRGAADSGDIDFIITKPDTPIETLNTIIMSSVIPLLFGEKYLQFTLATTTGKNGTKWHGAARLPQPKTWRRVDFLLVPWDEMGAALIYFTGNDIFNRSIRLLASKKGFRLNQHGLWENVMRGKGRERITQGNLVEAKSERRIFQVLGVPYRPPEHRIC